MPFSLQTSPDINLEVDLPLIDLSQFAQTTHGAHYHDIMAEVKHACQEWGIFRVVNHGIAETLIQDVESAVQQLCSLPAEAKQRLNTDDWNNSYENQNGRYVSHNGTDRFTILNLRHSESILEMSSKIWPQDGNPLFCKTVETYTLLLGDLLRKITKIILASLDLDGERFYKSDFENCTYGMGINHYKSEGKSIDDEAFVAHTDMGVVTILYTGNKGGLQVRSKEETWLNIKPLSNSFVVNIADCFKAWSNGRLRSLEHRVVCKGWADRISMTYFTFFPGDQEIWAPGELVDDNHPRRYRPFTFSQFWRDYLENANSLERRANFMDRYAV